MHYNFVIILYKCYYLHLLYCIFPFKIGYFEENIVLHFASSMISGLVTTAASMPVDIAKTRYYMTSSEFLFKIQLTFIV